MQYFIGMVKAGGAFLVLWAISRRLGKHLIRRLTLFDFISSITIGSLAATAIGSGQPPAVTLAGAITWAALALTFNRLDLTGEPVRSFLDGDPAVLIENGKVQKQNLLREQMTLKQLEALLREKGYFDISQVEFTLLETNGQISVLPKSQFRPLRPQDLAVATAYEGLSTQVLHEGKPLEQQLRRIGLDEDWLEQQLHQQGLAGPRAAFAAWVTSDGRLVVDRYADRPH